ncbi:methylated-DNA--[protein]-cysteine S-methyltransferase [Metamycoplasma buccale]|uniref:methylated-DNA--[protein]-cysteine S-methyltransferase n=1 Tax=Metamycoplasma buccale TaxID=55602 RepID=UPI00398F1388
MKEYMKYFSPIGTLLIESENEFITRIDLINNENIEKNSIKEKPYFIEIKTWLDNYFSGKINENIPKLKLYGTKFQISVWNALKELATFGKIITYKDLANYIAKENNKEKMSCRAIGNAVGKNPLLIIIPCHRVIGSNGTLTGFSCGIDAKIKLLTHENITLIKNKKDKKYWKVAR